MHEVPQAQLPLLQIRTLNELPYPSQTADAKPGTLEFSEQAFQIV